ncbi:MmcQ/YjbR family DNA-binding protein [Micromonospora siamensis]|uniref:Predicted DNA-binding protein, MmcQ/YjbR family n=1 Tax=Micromonospora siamensis TaxID=299152 RepID=A0A1C5I4N0_9ACTN|nr:MmcQ/YjbR family DNA-binding protein [Micromonospora siamensis]SCG53224.1 Predicted DNA-binding protein, MmcQ/YjbR family [Micromonospora siamensis]
MRREELLAYCLGKPGAWLDRPWEADEVVKVGSKIFAFLGAPDSQPRVWAKCGPDRVVADEWLHRFPGEATAAPYLGRYGWNALRLDGSIPDEDLLDAVDGSYDAVLARLPRRERP